MSGGQQQEPQPSTSSGIVRSSTECPLGDAEMELLKDLVTNPNNGRGGSNASNINPSILNTPSATIQSQWSNIRDNTPNPMMPTDTLEQNPVVVNPHNVQDIKVEHHAAAQQLVQLGQGQQQQIVQEYLVAQGNGNVGYDPFIDMQFIEQPSPTGFDPCFESFHGELNFDVQFDKMTAGRNKHWDFSTKLQKLFIDMDKDVLAVFNVGSQPPDGLVVRVLPVYAQAGFYREPVKRCPNHASLESPTNSDPFWREQGKNHHLIRVADDFAMYDEDEKTKRLSVMIPVKQPHFGSTSFQAPIKFMCLGSDTGGINRKPVKLIFTLEHGQGNVIGRQSFEVRICSCPKRDMKQEEDKANPPKPSGNMGPPNGDGMIRANSSMVYVEPPPGKKRKLEGVEEYIMVPVAKHDFQMINTMAENCLFARHTDNSKREMIKQHRKKLLRQFNPGKFAPPPKPKEDGAAKDPLGQDKK